MNFDLSDDQLLLEGTIDNFLQKECPISRIREIFDGEAGWDESIWNALNEMGIAGLMIAEPYGGAGLGLLDLAVVSERFGHRATPGPFLEHALAGLAIQLGGSESQRAKWLPALAAGQLRATIALGERGNLWEPTAWTASADEKVHGTKEHVLHAAGADLFVVGVQGGGLAVVEGGTSGITLQSLEPLDRLRRIQRVSFDGAPCEVLEKGVEASPRVLDAGLVLLAADSYGAGLACAEASTEYAKTREQFGVKIGTFQALKHQIANMWIDIFPTRGLYWYAAHAFDHALDDASAAAALAKAHITSRAMQVARDSVEAHGGIGYTWECDLQFWLKRTIFDFAYLGEPARHRRRAADLYGW